MNKNKETKLQKIEKIKNVLRRSKMNEHVKQCWVQALYSGRYSQYRGWYFNEKQDPHRKPSVCAIGVLYKEFKDVGYGMDRSMTDSHLTPTAFESIILLNDEYELKFKEIADIIEECL